MDYVPALARWLHFLAGVLWIGLLYHFNFVQVAALKAAQADGTAAGITKHVAPRALLYFRWAAVVTWRAGAALLGNQFVNAFTLRGGMAGIGGGAFIGTSSQPRTSPQGQARGAKPGAALRLDASPGQRSAQPGLRTLASAKQNGPVFPGPWLLLWRRS